jgi:hypothetical protein
MKSLKNILTGIVFLVAAMLWCQHRGRAAVPTVLKTPEELVKEWTFKPDTPPAARNCGTQWDKSGEKLEYLSIRIEHEGQSQRWFDAAARFYSEKCSADGDPVKKRLAENNENKRLFFTDAGTRTGEGAYLVAEPFILSLKFEELPARPQEFVFVACESGMSITVSLRRHDANIVLIVVTAAVQ